MGAAAAAAALGFGGTTPEVVAAGLAGAGLSATIRALAGDSPATLAGAALAPLLLVASLFDPVLGGEGLTRAAVAIAAAGWTVVELARPTTSPLVALLPACVAAVLDPSCVALVAIAGARLVTAPWRRPRWAGAVPVVGALAIVLAVLACSASTGALAALGDRWTGAPRMPLGVPALAQHAADVLGPLISVAALAGLAGLARPRHAEVALLACLAGALLVSARNGAIGPAALAVASVCSGLAVGRLAGLIRIGSGQALAGATASLLLLVAPAWTAIEHGRRVSIAHASR